MEKLKYEKDEDIFLEIRRSLKIAKKGELKMKTKNADNIREKLFETTLMTGIIANTIGLQRI